MNILYDIYTITDFVILETAEMAIDLIRTYLSFILPFHVRYFSFFNSVGRDEKIISINSMYSFKKKTIIGKNNTK